MGTSQFALSKVAAKVCESMAGRKMPAASNLFVSRISREEEGFKHKKTPLQYTFYYYSLLIILENIIYSLYLNCCLLLYSVCCIIIKIIVVVVIYNKHYTCSSVSCSGVVVGCSVVCLLLCFFGVVVVG